MAIRFSNLIYGLMIAIATLIPLSAFAQSSSSSDSQKVDTLATAKQISAASGRPIFAVAGRST